MPRTKPSQKPNKGTVKILSLDEPKEFFFQTPCFFLALIAFFFCYLSFYIHPVFLNRAHLMEFTETIPRQAPIGVDLRTTLQRAASFYGQDSSPYVGDYSIYPPLVFFLGGWLSGMDFPKAHSLVTYLSVACFFFTAFIFPFILSGKKQFHLLPLLLFVLGLFSYGFQFELERGQFNVIAIFFASLAVGLFHCHPRYRLLAFAIFSIAVNLKLYPAIFLLMFIIDWKDWRANLRMVPTLAVINLGLLLLLGFHNFLAYFPAVLGRSADPYVWVGNLSISSYSTLHPFKLVGILNNQGFHLGDPVRWTRLFLWGLFLASFGMVLRNSIRRKKGEGFNRYLFLACVIAAMVVPSESHDYKLPILVGAVALAFMDDGFVPGFEKGRRVGTSLVVLVFFLSYATTFFSYVSKKYYLANNLPALLVMLLCVAWLSSLEPGRKEGT